MLVVEPSFRMFCMFVVAVWFIVGVYVAAAVVVLVVVQENLFITKFTKFFRSLFRH